MNLVFTILVLVAIAAFGSGIVLGFIAYLVVSFRTPGFWAKNFGSPAERLSLANEVAERMRATEKTSGVAKLANRLLQIGTAMGVFLAIGFGALRLFGVAISTL